jgi:hypothetical protein
MTKEREEQQALQPQDSGQSPFAGYKGGEEMPLAGYATLMGIYNAAFAAMLLAAKNSDRRLPERIGYGDLLLLALTTYKLSRLIAKDRVTSPLRAPFTEYEGSAGASDIKEKVRGRGMRRAIGDLITCPFCLGPWVAAALAFGFVFKPRATRLIGGIFAAVTVSDFLQHAADAVAKEEEK